MTMNTVKERRHHLHEWIWWKHGVVYQLYPRSFYDSNGDGVGDLRGIIQKLDYLSWLGVDALWLSPINNSPMHDFGYDISDYRSIDPLFGTLHDFDELQREAHHRGIHIILDLVINHTSHLHPWFVESRSSINNSKRNWYIWRDGKKGKPPNNWRSSFGGSAWEFDEATQQYYLHSFLREQPDLNWRNPELKEAVFNDARFWLDRGVDGFRLDVVNWFTKDIHFRDNPLRFFSSLLQKHHFDRNRPDNHIIMKELRSLVDAYDKRMTVGEVFSFPPGDPHLSASYLGENDELHLAFDFSFIYRPWSARFFYKVISRWQKALRGRGWPCHVLSNHDQRRSMSRFGNDADALRRAKVAATMLLTLRGTPFLYYGEEIGMTNGDIPHCDICDPLGKRYWPFYAGRDGARTPMQWNTSGYAGFSSAVTWLPVNKNYPRINVERELNDQDSLLRHHRSLIHLRRSHEALLEGEWIPVIKGLNGVIAYYRSTDNEKVFVALNFTGKEKRIHIRDRAQWRVIHSTHRSSRVHFSDLEFVLFPYEAMVIGRIGDL
jgi:alpha-glucosidase